MMNHEKEKKYDRQLRLWGDHGQYSLENSKVCLIKAGATGTELLKNLILPGIGGFTIIDDDIVKSEDLGSNFFVNEESIGRCKAAVATELLSELNEDVQGDFVEDSLEAIIENKPDFFLNFNLVIATDVKERSLMQLGSILWSADIPLLICRSVGMIGLLRVVTKEHCIIESHPDNFKPDLRLDCPFPALCQFCDCQDLKTMSKKEHSHTPWLVILYKALEEYKQLNNGQFPSNYKEKSKLKDIIKSKMLPSNDGEHLDEENFDEAMKAVNTAICKTQIPDDILSILNDPRCTALNSQSKSFWFMAAALKEFIDTEGNGQLPLSGVLPDMTSDSSRYVKLQQIYRTEAERQAKLVEEKLRIICKKYDKTFWDSYSNDSRQEFDSLNLTFNDVKMFCKNAAFLRVINCKSLQDEFKLSPAHSEELSLDSCYDEKEELCWYLVLRAVDRFRMERGRWPCELGHWDESDVQLLRSHVNRLLASMGFSPSCIKDDYIQELCRFGGCELHSVASYMGGVAAQEVIKLISRQFVPVNGTLIYNAITQKTKILEL